MSAKELMKAAVIGLQNQNSYDTLFDESIHQHLQQKSYDNDSRRFLDAALIQVMQEELSQLPQPDSFEELPAIPEETRRELTPAQALVFQQLLQHKHSSITLALLSLLDQYGFALPHHLFVDLVDTRLDKASQFYLSVVGSQRCRWLIQLNENWRATLGNNIIATTENTESSEWPIEAFVDSSYLSALYFLNALNSEPEQQVAFIQAAWSQCRVNHRQLLLSYLPKPDNESDQTWLFEQLGDKSNHIKRELYRLLFSSQHRVADLQNIFDQAVELFSQFVEKKTLGRIDLTVPETLTDGLKSLGIFDQDYLALNLPKPVQRLGQLLVLIGPDGWGQAIGCRGHQAMEKIIKTRFKKELEPYLLEACLYHGHSEAMAVWCKRYKKLETVRYDTLRKISKQTGPKGSAFAVDSLLQHQRLDVMIDPENWLQFYQFGQHLTGEQAQTGFKQWADYARKHRYTLDPEISANLTLWLGGAFSEYEQIAEWKTLLGKEKLPPVQIDVLKQLFNFKSQLAHALEQE